jgi:hypothetical protein
MTSLDLFNDAVTISQITRCRKINGWIATNYDLGRMKKATVARYDPGIDLREKRKSRNKSG